MLQQIARIRTIDGAVRELKNSDPGSCITKHFIRQLVLSKKIKSVRAGTKYLINMLDLENFLANPPADEKEPIFEYGKLRKVT